MTTAAAARDQVTAPDGTRIAFTRSGAGPPLVLVHGTSADHLTFRFLTPLLADHFTLYGIDRRGRGDSGDGSDYAIELEFADVAAVMNAIEEPAVLFGHSFGATIALGAAPLCARLGALIMYEAAAGIPVVPKDRLDRVDAMIERGEREAALVEAFGAFGIAANEIEQLRLAPTWRARVEAAHTVTREVRAEADFLPDRTQYRHVEAPSLLLLGEDSPAWAHEAARRDRALLPNGRIELLPGEGHLATMTAPEKVAAAITGFVA